MAVAFLQRKSYHSSENNNHLLGKMKKGKLTLVLGIGNLLIGDEGVGVHAVRELELSGVPEHVRVLDGGTGGFHLLSLFQEFDPIIVVDATMDTQVEGHVQLRHPKYASEFPRTLSAHDIGLRDLLESATLLGPLPELFLVTVSIKTLQGLSTELSPKIRDSIPAVLKTVLEILDSEK
jgi:hydrogenase maturation protease